MSGTKQATEIKSVSSSLQELDLNLSLAQVAVMGPADAKALECFDELTQ